MSFTRPQEDPIARAIEDRMYVTQLAQETRFNEFLHLILDSKSAKWDTKGAPASVGLRKQLS